MPDYGYPGSVEALLIDMKKKEWWQLPAGFEWGSEWEDVYGPKIASWTADNYFKTDFEDGLPQGDPPGPFASFAKDLDEAGEFWTLTFAAPFTPYFGIFAILLKQAGEFGVWLFNVPEGDAVHSIRFEVAYWNDLSHAGLFGDEPTTVPEPSSLLLLGSGLLGLGFVGYRRRRK